MTHLVYLTLGVFVTDAGLKMVKRGEWGKWEKKYPEYVVKEKL